MGWPRISTAPGGPHADQGVPTEYRASRGGWYPVEDRPTPGQHGHDGRLRADDDGDGGDRS